MDSQTAQLISSLEQRLRLLEVKDSINSLLNTYCQGADTGSSELISKVFAADGQLKAKWVGVVSGRDNLAKGIGEGGKAYGHLMHSISNIQINVDGTDKASGTAYLSFYAVKDTKRLGANYAFGGPYQFEFIKENGEWKIQSVEVGRWWEQGMDETGDFQEGADSQ